MGPKTKWTPEMDALLGTMTDRQLAKELGIKQCRVTRHRMQSRIQPYRKHLGHVRRARGQNGGRAILWDEAMLAMLGKAHDSEVAKELGLGWATVLKKRNELGIPAFAKRRKYEPEAAIRMHQEAGSYAAMAYKLGVSPQAAHQLIKRARAAVARAEVS
jgi:DNA-directed RNA polymerase specialized sigma24 family protein